MARPWAEINRACSALFTRCYVLQGKKKAAAWRLSFIINLKNENKRVRISPAAARVKTTFPLHLSKKSVSLCL